ncbi:unnamed protein product, partial [Adineta ricciae]
LLRIQPWVSISLPAGYRPNSIKFLRILSILLSIFKRIPGMKYVADGLAVNTGLTDLTFTYNKLDFRSRGAQYFSTALENNRSLIKLCLDVNNIGAEGIRYLAKALNNNRTLSTLNLSKNNIGNEGAQNLAGALEKNTTLTSLILERSSIGTDGARALAVGLGINRTLITLNLLNNQIDLAAIEQ